MSPLNCSFSFFLARLIAVASTVYTCLVCNSSLVATCPSIPAARFDFRLFYSFLFLFVVVVSGEPKQKQGRGLVDQKLVQAPQKFLLLAVPRRLFCFGSLVILDVARCYLWLFTLYINIKIGKIVIKC